jgi:hypothetical protein
MTWCQCAGVSKWTGLSWGRYVQTFPDVWVSRCTQVCKYRQVGSYVLGHVCSGVQGHPGADASWCICVSSIAKCVMHAGVSRWADVFMWAGMSRWTGMMGAGNLKEPVKSEQ